MAIYLPYGEPYLVKVEVTDESDGTASRERWEIVESLVSDIYLFHVKLGRFQGVISPVWEPYIPIKSLAGPTEYRTHVMILAFTDPDKLLEYREGIMTDLTEYVRTKKALSAPLGSPITYTIP